MFILRQISADGLESNRTIGQFYELIRKSTQEKAFKELYYRLFECEQSKDNTIYAFVIDENGAVWHLFSGGWDYIMTESGKTFSKI